MATKCQSCGKTTWKVKICKKCGHSACPSCNFSSYCNQCKFGQMEERSV